MSGPRRGFLGIVLGLAALLLASCGDVSTGGKAKKAKATDQVGEFSKPDLGDDPGLDPTLPAVPLPTKEDPKTPKVSFDPFGTKDPGKSKAVFENPVTPKVSPTGETTEYIVAPLPVPKAGAEEPSLKPQIVALTWVGGTGNQWIQEVGFTPEGLIYARGGGGGFTVYYSADGIKRVRIEGDVNKPSTGPRGPNVNTRGTGAFRTTCPTTKIQMEIGMESFGLTKSQPYLKSSADWKWWGWDVKDMGKGLESSARGINIRWLHDDRFLAKVFVDSGKTTAAKDPRDLKKDNSALAAAALRDPGGVGTLYMSGRLKSGTADYGTFVKGKVLAEAIDPWERLYVSQPWEGKMTPDALKIGGAAGFTIINANLTNPLYTASIGADNIYCMAIKDNLLVIGGNIGMPVEPDPKVKPKNLPPLNLNLKVRAPAQDAPGGDEDGLLAIIKLW